MSSLAGGLREQLLHAARGSVLLRVVALVATMATSVVLARTLGPSAYGTYAYVFAIVTLLALPSQVGIPALLVRETAKAQANEDWPRLRGLWSWATRVILVTSIVIAMGAALAVMWRTNHMNSDMRWTLVAGIVLVPLIALGNARGAALRGLRLIVRGQLPETVLRPVMLVVFIGLAGWLAGPVSAPEAMAWHVLAAAIAFMIGAAILLRARPANVVTARVDMTHVREWWHAALPLALISGLQVAGNQSGIVLLGWLRPQTDVGVYKVAVSAAALALFGLQTTNLVVSPHIARLHALADHVRLQRIASIGALVGAALTVPAFIGFAFAGKWLLQVLYGHAYIGAYQPLMILAAGQVMNACFGLSGALMSMTGHERDAAKWLTLSAGTSILFGVLLIPAIGMLGAAIAQVLSMTIWNVAFWRIILKKVGVDSSLRGLFEPGFLRSLLRNAKFR